MTRDLTKFSHQEIVLHAVLLSRTINKRHSKEHDVELFNKCSDAELIEYIEHFNDPEITWDEVGEAETEYDDCYTPSSTGGDYGPSNPWDAPGMSIRDFI